MSAEERLREAAVESLADSYAGNIRREARRASLELAPVLCGRYAGLTSEKERRQFWKAHEADLKFVGGLLSVCMATGRPLSARAFLELKELEKIRPAGMRRSTFDALNPRSQMDYIRAGGKVSDPD